MPEKNFIFRKVSKFKCKLVVVDGDVVWLVAFANKTRAWSKSVSDQQPVANRHLWLRGDLCSQLKYGYILHRAVTETLKHYE